MIKTSTLAETDPDLAQAAAALERAAARARELAELTHTPLYVFSDGKIINLREPGYVLRDGRIEWRQEPPAKDKSS